MPALTIGGATVTLQGRWPRMRVADPLYRPFLGAGGRPTLALDVRFEPPPAAPGEVRFAAFTRWRVIEAPHAWWFECDGDRPAGRCPLATIAVDRGWRSATLWLGRRRQTPLPLAYPLEQLLLVSILARAGGLVIHAAGVVLDGSGWVFAGTHGAGKSTLARLFGRRPGAVVLNDDRVVVRRVDGRWRVFGTPWSGTVRRTSGVSAPLAGVLLIRHGHATRATPLSPALGVPRLVARCFHPYWDRPGLGRMLATAAALAKRVPLYDFPFVPDLAAVLETLPRRLTARIQGS